MLTKTDREFLQDPDGYYTASSAKQMRYERRGDIKTRIRESILDLALLFDLYEDQQDLVDDVFTDAELKDALGDAIALFVCGVTTGTTYSGRRPRSINGPADIGQFGMIEGRGDHHSEEFLQILGDGLARGLFEYDNILLEQAELHTETTRVPDARIQRDLEEGEILHPKAAALLLKSGEIDPEAFSDFAREQLLDDE